jgi:hypothetical protein
MLMRRDKNDGKMEKWNDGNYNLSSKIFFVFSRPAFAPQAHSGVRRIVLPFEPPVLSFTEYVPERTKNTYPIIEK